MESLYSSRSIITITITNHGRLGNPTLSCRPHHPVSLGSSASSSSLRHKSRHLSIRASHSPPPHPSPPKTLSTTLLKPTAVALAAGAALLLAALLRRPHPATAAAAAVASPPSQSDTIQDSDSTSENKTLTEDEKEKILEEYLDTHPDDVRSLRALMELKIKAKKLPEAIEIIDRLIALEPGEKDLPLLRAHLQSYAGDVESAKLGFEEILKKDPFLVEAYHGLVMTSASSSDSEIPDADLGGILKRIEGAMEMCKKEKRKDDLRDFKLLVAQVKVMEGSYEDALKVYRELVKEEPRDFRPYLCQGIIYTLLRKKDEAEKQFQKYRRLVPKGHPYAQYFDENMVAMKVFSQIDENRRTGALKR